MTEVTKHCCLATIVSWFARGASPIDGMYWIDANALRAETRAGDRPC